MSEVYPQWDDEHRYGMKKIGPRTYVACDCVPHCRKGTKKERRAAEARAAQEDES